MSNSEDTMMKEGKKQHLLTNLDMTIQSIKDVLDPKEETEEEDQDWFVYQILFMQLMTIV